VSKLLQWDRECPAAKVREYPSLDEVRTAVAPPNPEGDAKGAIGNRVAGIDALITRAERAIFRQEP